MTFLEKNLEDIVFETPNHLLKERGLPIRGKKFRQVKIGNYGIADLITLNRQTYVRDNNVFQTLYVTIYELKKDLVDIGAMMQAFRYRKGIECYFDERNIFQDIDGIEYHTILIGKEINLNNDFAYTIDAVNELTVYTYLYSFNGISFKDEYGYSLTNPNFGNIRKSKSIIRDTLPF